MQTGNPSGSVQLGNAPGATKVPGMLETTLSDINGANDRLQDILNRLRSNNDSMFGAGSPEVADDASVSPAADSMVSRIGGALEGQRRLLISLEDELGRLVGGV